MTDVRDACLAWGARATGALDAAGAGETSRLALRAAGPGDEAFLATLFRDDRRGLFAAAGLSEPMLEGLLAQQYRAHETGRELSFPRAARQVIVVDATPIGRLTTADEPHGARRSLRVVDVVLRPEWRGRGLGTALFADIAGGARAAGFAHLTLSALRFDAAVQRFYRRLGFAAIGGDEVHVALALDLDAAEG